MSAGLSERIARISFSSTMEVAARAEQLRRSGAEVVDLSVGEPDFPTPEHIKQAAIRAIHEDFTRYTPAAGMRELREAVCERHAADFGTRYEVPECLITSGGKHAVFNFIETLVNPGDEVIIPAPYWVTYRDAVLLAGGRAAILPTAPGDGFALRAEEVRKRLSPATRMLIVNAPNNPTGALLNAAEAAELVELAASRGFWILSDECYASLVYDGEPFSIASLPGAARSVLVAGSLSKAYAMTGWRIGYGLGPAQVIEGCVRLQSHSTSNPNSIAQRAALEALRGPQDCVTNMREEYRRRRDYVIRRLRDIQGVTVHSPGGAFYAFPGVSALLEEGRWRSSAVLAERLLEEVGVACVPGEAFGAGGHLRISFAASWQALEEGLDRIASFLARAHR
ncbi:MAG: pyridoxal phosphate-dependent aminotransferase [Bryobacterales bacterium]|nr:pyridoxal phosphate-dependent aminotransferase [Bryobacteraceae bacterium]MDW8130453.1 pyridoxal phosphate-dependent aminotransferase [Bryobacterales bacterium]